MSEPDHVPTEPHSVDHAGLEILSNDECRRFLESARVGRIAFIDHGEPVILPITMGMWGRSIVFSTGPGSKLSAAIMHQPVAVEIDAWDAEAKRGWSVLVKGTATTVDDAQELDDLEKSAVHAWVEPESKKDWVRVLPNEITGRRVPEPS